MRTLATAACLTLVALAACGEDDEGAAPAPPAELADLQVTYDRDGKGGRTPREARVRCSEPADSAACRALADLTAEDLAPTPDDVACTLQYGGPQTARVTGTLRGARIDASFSRENGCEINRWERVKPLLEGTG